MKIRTFRRCTIFKKIFLPFTWRQAALATLALAILITILAFSPLPKTTFTLPGDDKLHHLIAFAVLTIPLTVVNPRNALWLVPVVILYGGIIEIAQPLVGRRWDWGDLWFNLIGALIGALLGSMSYRLFYRRKRTNLQ